MNEDNTQIYNQVHEMYAEGTLGYKPDKGDIILYLLSLSFAASNVDIWFDGFQGVWKWYADIDEIE